MVSYIITSILAIVLGQVVSHLCKKLPPVVEEKITYKEYYKTLFTDFKVDIKFSVIQLILFNMLIYYLHSSLVTYLYMFVISILLIVFDIDYRYQLIPDEAHIALGVIGIINLIANLSNWSSYLLGALTGGVIFLALGGIALVIYKKEGMGFGDVKLMTALGFIFGLKNILIISLLSFFFGAIVGIILLLTKVKKSDSYMPFGPFIAIATVFLMFISPDVVINVYITFCSWLGMKISDFIYFFVK